MIIALQNTIISPLKKPKINRKGITLVELTLVLALAAIIIFVAIRAYSQAQANSRLQQGAAEVGQVKAAVDSLYPQGPYTNLLTSQILSVVPTSLVNTAASTITNPWNGTVDLFSDQVIIAGDSYDIGMTNLTADACMRLATMDMGRTARYINVSANNNDGPVAKGITAPMTASQAQSACTGTLNAVTWQFQ